MKRNRQKLMIVMPPQVDLIIEIARYTYTKRHRFFNTFWLMSIRDFWLYVSRNDQ